MPIQLDLMPAEDKLPESPPPKTIVVRYGYLREIGEFPSDLTQKVGCGTKLVLRSERGTEIGEMLTTVCGNGGCSKSITRDKLLAYIENSGGRDYPFSEQGRVLRVATTQDLAEQAKLDENRAKHVTLARDLVAGHKLPMKIVDVEHLLGGERVLFYFVSEQRVDFRSLVRDLAHALHTRIELRQVGARDEARITADYEKCGQHCCCKQFLKVLTPISMRSAKVQKATLDPTKISGRCGRLMCCLRYEDETYEELRKKLPKRNTRVKTEKGDAWVIDGQILTQLVLVQFDDGKREAFPMEKILGFDQPKPVMADGRIMQTPNDRPPMGMEGPPARRGPGGPNGGPNGGPQGRRERPKPGAPVQAPDGDPLSTTGPTGGDLNTGAGGAAPRDEIDDLIADAMDDGIPPLMPGAESTAPVPEGTPLPPVADDAPAQPPATTPPPPRNVPQAGGPRGPMPPRGGRGPGAPGGPGGRPPQGARQPQGNRPPQGPRQGGGGGGTPTNKPQGFRPPKPQGQRPPGGPLPPPPGNKNAPPSPSSPQASAEFNGPPLTQPPATPAPPTPPPPAAPENAPKPEGQGEQGGGAPPATP
jgi:cell fate regulator YaaT (PSP1 superfamily)